jgi:hypothetical protein
MKEALLEKAHMIKQAQNGTITVPKDASNIQLLGGGGGIGGGGGHEMHMPMSGPYNSAIVEGIMYNAVDGMNKGIDALSKVVERLSPQQPAQQAVPEEQMMGPASQEIPPEILARIMQGQRMA